MLKALIKDTNDSNAWHYEGHKITLMANLKWSIVNETTGAEVAQDVVNLEQSVKIIDDLQA